MEYLLSKEQSAIPARFRSFVSRTNVDVSQSEIRPLVKMELKLLKKDLVKRAKASKDPVLQSHYEDSVDRIEKLIGD